MCAMFFGVFSSNFAQASEITADMVIKLTNKARESAKIASLKKNELLMEAAKKKAKDMVENNYFAHISPDGKSPWDWIEGAGYEYQYAGENLAINFSDAEQQQEAWMDSPLHRKNIMNQDYEEIGVAVRKGVIDGHETIVTVQEFGSRVPSSPQVASAFSASEIPKAKKIEALSEVVPVGSMPKQVASVQKISDKIDNNILFLNNKPTIIGWLAAFGIALSIIIIDVAAVFHKKHEQLFILHDARK